MRRAIIALLVIALAVACTLVGVHMMRPPSAKLIGILQFVHQPLLDETHRGLVSELRALGLDDGINYRVETRVADKDVQLCAQITKQFLDQHASLLIPIATPAAQAAASQCEDTPIVFAVITDPVAAGLVESLDRPGRNITGTSNRWPFEKQIALVPRILPAAKTLGALWNPGEVNSQAAMGFIRPLAKKAGLEIVEVPVATTADVAAAARGVADKVDAFLMIPDNTTLAATSVLAQIALDTRKPLIGGDMDTVRQGSVATYGYDYFELGRLTATMAKEVLLDKKDPKVMSVRFSPKESLIVNERTAARLNLRIPDDVKANAVEVVK